MTEFPKEISSIQTKIKPPEFLLERIKRFEEQFATYHSSDYNEASLRLDFLDSFFKALGWDVNNDGGASERYKDVVVEHPVSVDGHVKRTDYIFRLGETEKFIVEAKKPSINILTDTEAAYQLRMYGWNRHLNLCALTNFENFAIYDVRNPPKRSDLPNVGRIQLPYSFREYDVKWDEIASIFSKDSVRKGRFDDEAEKTERQGNEPVDDYFLREIEEWRRELATNLKLRNQELTQPELNFSVQAILDRIIFLRICEDRGIEPKGRLKSCIAGNGVYAHLFDLFRFADQRYNSGLFHFDDEKGRDNPADKITKHLKVDDDVIRKILRQLYDAPYDFRQIPLEVLGQVYEQFLGKVIVVTEKRAKVVSKPEVRKQGGVFYTPQYVVNYIVKNTVEPLLYGKTPEEVSNLKILDPACGSGSFLLQAYQVLLDWHLEQYVKNPKNWKSRIVITDNDIYALSGKERTRILLNNIFGVDVDSQAAEVTKLSLLLKALEKTPSKDIDIQLKLYHERALPDLGGNIKQGNSLMEENFYSSYQISLLDPQKGALTLVFPWEKEFRDIFSREDKGFDVIIGNPPYIPIEMIPEKEKRYLEMAYPELDRKYDSSVTFILAMLPKLRSTGKLGFISSVAWQTGENYSKIREKILKKYGLERIINLPYNVFKDAYVDTGIYTITKRPRDSYGLFQFPKKEKRPNLDKVELRTVLTSAIHGPDYKLILDPIASTLLSRLATLPGIISLGALTISTQGLAAGRFNRVNDASIVSYPFLAKGQIYRYSFEPQSVIRVDMSNHGSLVPHYLARPKILIRRVISRDDRLLCSFFDGEMVFKKDVNPFTLTDSRIDPMYILGVLNSRLMSYLYLSTSSIATKDDFRQTTLAELRRLPILIYPSETNEVLKSQERVAALALQITTLIKKLPEIRTESERTAVFRNLDALDSELDKVVYSLYGLSEEEAIRIQQATMSAKWRTSTR